MAVLTRYFICSPASPFPITKYDKLYKEQEDVNRLPILVCIFVRINQCFCLLMESCLGHELSSLGMNGVQSHCYWHCWRLQGQLLIWI